MKAGTDTYRSSTLTGTTAQEFDNGWQRLYVTFTLTGTQTVEVRAAAECTSSAGTGSVAFDCMQLEDGDTADSYNILEDGSFERGGNCTAATDGAKGYQIQGEPGKNKNFIFKTHLGPNPASFTLTGWIKAETTPIRKNRELYVL